MNGESTDCINSAGLLVNRGASKRFDKGVHVDCWVYGRFVRCNEDPELVGEFLFKNVLEQFRSTFDEDIGCIIFSY